jgi:hypothetical protein
MGFHVLTHWQIERGGDEARMLLSMWPYLAIGSVVNRASSLFCVDNLVLGAGYARSKFDLED